jgi:hypothetical protein
MTHEPMSTGRRGTWPSLHIHVQLVKS